MNDSGTVIIIPARGNSKGVRRKNLRDLAGKPLIAHTIDYATTNSSLRVVVTTDDEEIAAISKRHGADVPFMRPVDLAADDASMLPVLIHAADELRRQGEAVSRIVVLQPTSPIRRPERLPQALALLSEVTTDAVVSLAQAKSHPFWLKVLDGNNVAPFMPAGETVVLRQDLPPVYQTNGSLYAITVNALERRRGELAGFTTQFPEETVRPLLVTMEEAVDIDTELDFAFAEWLVKERHVLTN